MKKMGSRTFRQLEFEPVSPAEIVIHTAETTRLSHDRQTPESLDPLTDLEQFLPKIL
jgi:hypothetical protein